MLNEKTNELRKCQAPLGTLGVIVQYRIEYGFIMSAAICAVPTVLVIWLNVKAGARKFNSP